MSDNIGPWVVALTLFSFIMGALFALGVAVKLGWACT